MADQKDAISSLVGALQCHGVAKKLRSRETKGIVAGELGSLFGRLYSDNADVTPFLPLAKLVVREATDIEIWREVLELIATLARRTPPRRIGPSFDGTPRTHSSASFQDSSEQTRRKLGPELIYELKNNTFSPVEGFFTKYFDDKHWTPKSRETYDAAKERFNFPAQNPTQENVWDWLKAFQEKHLSETRGFYYTTSGKSEMAPAQPERQLDIFVKHRYAPSDRKHDWQDVRVVGEHTKSSKNGNWTHKFVQLATYVRDVFSYQPTRRFVHGFLLFGKTMEQWIFDRSGAYGTEAFDVSTDPERFVRAIAGYVLMSDEELGLNTFVEREEQKRYVTVTDNATCKRLRLELEPDPIFVQNAIVCRGTSCYLTKDKTQVVKFSWASNHNQEAENLKKAREKGVKGVARLVGHSRIASIADHRDGLTFAKRRKIGVTSAGGIRASFQQSSTNGSATTLRALSLKRSFTGDLDERPPKKSLSDNQGSKLKQELHPHNGSEQAQSPAPNSQKEIFRNRVLSCLVILPAGRPFREFTTIKALLQAFRDAIQAHKLLFLKGRILHRDVSENNLIMTDPTQNDGFSGMLIDLDLAAEVEEGGKNKRTGAQMITGTRQFMAIEVLEGVSHTYRHDLESFFYALLWTCVSYGWGKNKKPKVHPLRRWYNDDFSGIANTKSGHMQPRNFEKYVLDEFSPKFESVKGLARRLRQELFSRGALNTSTPSKSPSKLYNAMLKAFQDTIEAIKW